MKKGFTLVEVLIVMGVLAVLAVTILTTLNPSGAGKKARDLKRIKDMAIIQVALEEYKNQFGQYPSPSNSDCSGWDAGAADLQAEGNPFIEVLKDTGVFGKTPVDPGSAKSDPCNHGYAYYHYSVPDNGGCTCNFYVLGVRDMETSGRPHPQSPGWKCPTRNWQDEFDWVTGQCD